jgi:hypothetical protein
MGLFSSSKSKQEVNQTEQEKPRDPNDRVYFKDIAHLNENIVVLGERITVLTNINDSLKLVITDLLQAMKGNGHKETVIITEKSKSPTEKIIELLSQSEEPLLDSEIAESIGSPLPSVKKILSTNLDSGGIEGLANLGKGKWRIIKLKTEEGADATVN